MKATELFNKLANEFVEEVRTLKQVRTDKLKEVLLKHLEANQSDFEYTFSYEETYSEPPVCPRQSEVDSPKPTEEMEISELSDRFLQAAEINNECQCGQHSYLEQSLNLFSGEDGKNILFQSATKKLKVQDIEVLVKYFRGVDNSFNLVETCPDLLIITVENALLTDNEKTNDLVAVIQYLIQQGFSTNDLISQLIERGRLDSQTVKLLHFVVQVQQVNKEEEEEEKEESNKLNYINYINNKLPNSTIDNLGFLTWQDNSKY